MWEYDCSNELIWSSSEEPPSVNMGFFFFAGSVLAGSRRGIELLLRMGVGIGLLLLERIDVETQPGVKPCTTL